MATITALRIGSAAHLLIILAASGCAERVDSPIRELGREAILTVELRVDGRDQELTAISHHVAIRGDGVMAVAPFQQGRILFYSPAGTHIGTVGEHGEVSRVSRIGWRADTLWIWDVQPWSISLVSPDLKVARVIDEPGNGARIRLEDNSGEFEFLQASPLALYSDGSMMALLAMNGSRAAAEHQSVGRRFFGVLSPEREVLKVLANLPAPEGGSIFVPTEGSVDIPFTNAPVWAVSPDGGILVSAMAYVRGSAAGTLIVSAWSKDGEQVFQKRYIIELEAIPRSVKDSVVSARVSGLGLTRPGMAAALRGAPLSNYYPPLEGAGRLATNALLVGQDSTIWLELRKRAEGRPIVVLDPRGDVVGTVYVPEDARIVAAEQNRIWLVEQDSVGVDALIRYGITWR